MSERKNNKPILIMMYVSLSTFTKRDILLLSDDFQVINYHFDTSQKWKLPLAFVKQSYFLIKNIRKMDVIVSQSAGYLSFGPSIFSKITKIPLVIIAIGTDCIKLPEINYGAHSKKLLALFTRLSFRNANLILPVHKSLEFNDYTYTTIRFPKQGIRAFVKNIQTPIVEVVNGFDFEIWKITNQLRKPNSFLTVTTSIGETGYLLKGIDMIMEMAKQNPNFNFTIVGKVFLPEACPTNVQLMENVPHRELVEIYNQHQYYMQLSLSEGFPNALCEAMLCGCIPIGSKVAAIPDIIGNEGFVLKNKSKDALKKLISELEISKPTPESVRKRIVEKFPLERRKRELISQIKSLLELRVRS